jgi:hypothetical protein
LLLSLKFFGLFPINFGEKYGELKNGLYNLLVSSILATTFCVAGIWDLNPLLNSTTEQESYTAYLTYLMEILSAILCFLVIKLYLHRNQLQVKKYFGLLQDLEATMKTFPGSKKKIDQIIENLGKSTWRREVFLIIYYFLTMLGYYYCATADNVLLYTFDCSLYLIFDSFFIQILIFLKMNMDFVRSLQNHLNQVLLDRQESGNNFNVEPFIKIHLKIQQFLKAMNEAFGFIFFMVVLAEFGCNLPDFYVSILTLVQSDFKMDIKSFAFTVLNMMWISLSYTFFCQFTFECDRVKEKVSFVISELESLSD